MRSPRGDLTNESLPPHGSLAHLVVISVTLLPAPGAVVGGETGREQRQGRQEQDRHSSSEMGVGSSSDIQDCKSHE